MEGMEVGIAGRILVTGDAVVDHHIYVGSECTPGEGGSERPSVERVELGGAHLVKRLLDGLSPSWHVGFGLDEDHSCYRHSYALWERYVPPGAGKNTPAIWLAKAAGSSPENGARPARSPASDEPADIVVIDEADLGFRDRAEDWPVGLRARPAPTWVVWKVSDELNGGALWQELSKQDRYPNLVLIVRSSDLRRSGFEIATGLSWERSALDVLRGLPATHIAPLRSHAHLVVTFPDAGALWVDPRGRTQLIYRATEDDGGPIRANRPRAFGFQACLTAGLVWSLASEPDLGLKSSAGGNLLPYELAFARGLRRGLRARLNLYLEGHGRVVSSPLPTGFPAARLQDELRSDPPGRSPFYAAEIPADAGDDWTIVQQGLAAPGPFFDTACSVARQGPDALRAVPRLTVGGYVTIERREIEAIRRLRQRLQKYVDAPQKQPLSVAIFGAPGAGKSYIVEQLAKGLLGQDLIECNLSQFSDERELQGAFHRVRDAVLTGITPVVFWDEFDSQEYRWLRLLLAPMQDGVFREGQVVHPIGKCIFVFAGGTSATFESFGEPARSADDAERARHERAWRMVKGVDFKSRIDAHLDVLGPNPRLVASDAAGAKPRPDPTDACFPIRRALFMHGRWNLADGKRVVSPHLVEALLRVPVYRHGSRSLKRVLADLARSGFPIGPDALPPVDDLELDIDGLDACRALLDRAHARGSLSPAGRRLEEHIDEFAERINAKYMELPAAARSNDVTLHYDSLSLFNRESNRAAVRRLERVLRAAGLAIVERRSPLALSEEEGLARLETRLVPAAQAEHEGWCDFHVQRGWVAHPQQDQPKDPRSIPPRHPALVEWDKLSEPYRDKDQKQVRLYGQLVYDMGQALAPLGPGDT